MELPEEIFGIAPNDHVIYLAVKQYLAASHQGTHNVKDRSDVKGSSRKLHRQKGTGGSRKGNIRNPLYRGGGSIFGPKPHSYDFKMNRKEKDLAKISALSYKASGGAIRIVEELQIETPKTKQFAGVLKSLDVAGKKVLFVTPDYDDAVYRSLRNLPTVKGVALSDLNTYDIVNSQFLVFTEEAVKVFEGDEAEAGTEQPAAPAATAPVAPKPKAQKAKAKEAGADEAKEVKVKEKKEVKAPKAEAAAEVEVKETEAAVKEEKEVKAPKAEKSAKAAKAEDSEAAKDSEAPKEGPAEASGSEVENA